MVAEEGVEAEVDFTVSEEACQAVDDNAVLLKASREGSHFNDKMPRKITTYLRTKDMTSTSGATKRIGGSLETTISQIPI